MNKNIEKYMYILAELLIIACFSAFVYFNFDKTVQYTCPVMQKVYTTKLVYLAAMIFAAAYAAGYVCCAYIKTKVAELCNAYQKRHENVSIEKDGDKARIQVLEAKIKTLEVALESALKNK